MSSNRETPPTISELIESTEELEPETLKQLFPNLDSLDRQKIMAMRLLRHHRAPYEDFDVFENVCQATNDIEPETDQMEGCKPRHIWYTLKLTRRLFGGELPPLAEEVKIYIKGICKEHGFQFYPEDIGVDNPKLKEVKQAADKGPYPIGDDPMKIQAARYLKVQKYLEKKSNQRN